MYKIIIFIFALFLTGCASTSIDRYDDLKLESNAKDYSVKITDLSNENRKFKTIALIEVKVGDVYSPEMVFSIMRKECNKLGGDALSDMTQQPLQQKFPPFIDWLNFYREIWTAEVVVWEDK